MNLKPFLKSNKTTTAAVIAFVSAFGVLLQVGSAAFDAQFDGDPATVPDWNVVAATVAILATSIGQFFARDADKSSQVSGVR